MGCPRREAGSEEILWGSRFSPYDLLVANGKVTALSLESKLAKGREWR